MHRWKVDNGTLQFGAPTADQIAHHNDLESVRIRHLLAGADDDSFSLGELVGDDEDDEGDNIDDLWVAWWYQADECTDEHCGCGPLTMLEAVERLGVRHRQDALDVHVAAMRSLFDHFWSGQGLIEGSSERVGNACPQCLIHGARHVWEVFDIATSLGEELGETISAFDCKVTIGPSRFRPGIDI